MTSLTLDPRNAVDAVVPCSALAIVALSRSDTNGTKSQVEANNHVITAVCGK